MKKAIVFPTFWDRPSNEDYHSDDFYYDHPLPVDQEGWLPRCFEELRSLDDQDFLTIIVAGANTPEVASEARNQLDHLIQQYGGNLDTYVFSYQEFEALSTFGTDRNLPVQNTLSMEGYSDLRNLCLVAANLLDVDLAVSIDDDVVFPDKSYLQSVEQTIKNATFQGDPIEALGGLYQHHEEASKYMHVPQEAWAESWNTTEMFNRDFREVIESDERFHETPFAIMGNIAVTQDFYMNVPLDPAMRRGEDSDWVFNAHLLDRRFVIDSELFVHHLPPERPHPVWRSMREDIARFLYQRQKFHDAREHKESFPPLSFFKPYPGGMWTEELEEKIREGCQLLATKYLTEDRPEDARETLKNITLGHHKFSNIDQNPAQSYLDYQSNWTRLMKGLREHAGELRSRLW